MTWQNDLNYGLAAFGIQLPTEFPLDRWAASLTQNPAKKTAAVLIASSTLFYIAERDFNPKVNDIYDAFVYCSTCLSVGYGDIFAKTPLGKIIGTFLMTVGPALSSSALDGPTKKDLQQEVMDTLKQILAHPPQPNTN
jgi:hypothetical protein